MSTEYSEALLFINIVLSKKATEEFPIGLLLSFVTPMETIGEHNST